MKLQLMSISKHSINEFHSFVKWTHYLLIKLELLITSCVVCSYRNFKLNQNSISNKILKMGPIFKQISSKEELTLVEKYLIHHLPRSAQMLNLVRLTMKKRFPKSMNISIYKYVDNEIDTRISTTEQFIVCTQRPNIHSPFGVIILAPENPTPLMLQTLEEFIDWDSVHLFSNLTESLAKHLKSLCDKHGNKFHTPGGIPGIMYRMDLHTAMPLGIGHTATDRGEVQLDAFPRVSENVQIEVKNLGVNDAEKITQKWKWALPHSKEQIEENIKSLNSTGVFINSELASWVVLSPMGTINMLYTDEAYRRKGYGEIVMDDLTKSVASDGLIPLAETEVGNDQSGALLEKLGFQRIYNTFWIYFEK